MGQALYRKHRSKKLDEVAGQAHITDTLKKALKAKKLSHAYLFTGPRGVGKTSVARILAHEVNDFSYDDETVHLDIIEIDAASNRRIDEIRDLRDKVNIMPSVGKYKVYIIDEVHMLTKEAFNALLKTLEEPPAHCIFILATTEGHKLPDTIVSRTQRFIFKPIAAAGLSTHLKSIAAKETIDITPSALRLLAEHAGGSFRDGISLLDQLSHAGEKITDQTVMDMLGIPSRELAENILSAVSHGDGAEVIKQLSDARDQAVNPAYLAATLSQALRNGLAGGKASSGTPQLLKNLLEVPASSEPYDVLEINLLEAAAEQGPGRQPEPNASVARKAAVLAEKKSITTKEAPAEKSSIDPASQKFDISMWPKVIELVRSEAASLYTALRLAVPELADGLLTLKFQFPLHQKKISSAGSLNLIGGIIEDNFGAKLEIVCTVDKTVKPPEKEPVPVRADDSTEQVNSISSIFGPSELLESGEAYG